MQDLINGIDWIADRFAGKTCVDLDIDRQSITPFGTPQQVDDLVRTEVAKIGRREGGLMMTYGIYPGTPIANVKAMMDAMERYGHIIFPVLSVTYISQQALNTIKKSRQNRPSGGKRISGSRSLLRRLLPPVA